MNKLVKSILALGISISVIGIEGLGRMERVYALKENPEEKKNDTRIHSNFNSNYKKDGELIVKYRENLKSTLSKDDIYRKNNIKLKKSLMLTNTDLVKIPLGVKEDEIISKLKKDYRVEWVQPNYIYYPQSTNSLKSSAYLKEEEKGEYQWGIVNTGQSINGQNGVPDVDMNIEEAWGITKGATFEGGDKENVVAVLDTGIDIGHPDLKNSIWMNKDEIPGNGIDDDGNGYIDDLYGWDFYNNDNSVFDPMEGDQHGTHVAGIIGASNNGIGIIGVVPEVKIMPLKFIGPFGGTTADAIKAIEYAKKKGVKIVNCSWANNTYDVALKEAIENSGALFIASAGNDGELIDSGVSYPASFNSTNIISVASVNNKGELSYFSNYGVKNVDIAAPGEGILSTVPKKIKVTGAIKGNNTFYQGFGLEAIESISERKNILDNVIKALGINYNDPILIVQDDESDFALPNYLNSYKAPLQDLGYKNITTYNVPFYDNGPSLNKMKQYKLMLWFTGESYDEPITINDEDNLVDYIKSGGKLYLSGENLGESLKDSELLLKYMGVKVLFKDEGVQAIKGIKGTTFEGINVNESYITEQSNYKISKGGNYALEVNKDSYVNTQGYTINNNAASVLEYLSSYNYDRSYEFYDGTSMAAPYITGLAALLQAKGITNIEEIKNRILNNYKPLETLKNKVANPGIPNAFQILGGQPVSLDVNSDGTVDIKDLAYMAQKYNLRYGEANWDYKYDLNSDGIIDIFDLVKVSNSIR